MRAAPITALVLLVGCANGKPDLGPFRIRPTPNTDELGGCPASDLESYEMSCGARLSIRILDADSRELLDSACVDVAPAADLTGLRDAMVPPFLDLPTRMLRLEVALWNPEMLPEEVRCPDEEIFDLQGVPRVTFEPQPAFAGAAFFDAASDDEIAQVPLACTDPDQIGGCMLERTRVTVSEILDVTGLLEITSAQASGLLVGVGTPHAVPIDLGGTLRIVQVLDSPDILPLQPGPVPIFQDSFDETFGDTLCTVVIENVAQATPAVVCEPVAPGAPDINLRDGAFLEKDTLDRLMSAAGIDQFPTEGLVVGRVVDDSGLQPMSEVAVTPVGAGDAEIFYLDSDLSGLNSTPVTGDGGYFLASGVPFGTEWTAVHAGDGLREAAPVRAGLIQGKITVLIVRMEPPPQAG